ncbi:uncharacterized protein LOC130358153 isoform X2 [Hyla sarda]|uniref:uncharacterized protein LOC130358153 isoform X2 n=1 Tax=Hyla sarda TaxID=327740 RepID=UPI0024C33072|nr:uncharacterized protein LOC130358153 isoform X2 [Hyla sarda]
MTSLKVLKTPGIFCIQRGECYTEDPFTVTSRGHVSSEGQKVRCVSSRTAMVLFTNDPTRMEKARKHMAARILHLTLEIIHLITGEDYTVVKKWSGECVTPRVSGGSGTTQSPTPEDPPPHSLIHEQKILELTTRITELLTGEVPIRCQDVTVYFSMEEWEYIEGHKDLYQDIVMMGDHRLPTSPLDWSSQRNPPERCPRPLYPQDCPEETQNVPPDHQAMVLFTNDPTRMEKARKHMAARILHLTLEIIHLITGEDYTVVKKWSGECVTPRVSGGSGTTQSPTPEDPPPHSLIHEQKILELTTRMTELLTGEVPIRCQDVTVYFSMEEWEYVEGHKDLYQDIVMMGDHRPPTSQDIDPTRMEKARKHMAARILHLTLEIIHLITGEDYTVVKKWSGECVTPRVSGGSGTTQSPTPEDPPPHSLIHEQKILELTTRMTELLTGEVPIRCQDVTVYFSMEEWEYIEGHKDLYQDIVMMGDHRTPTSQDIDPTRMEKARKHMAARILHLTLEIIHLITGEDYTVVKKWSGECVTPRVSGGSGTTQSPTPEDPPHHSLIHEQKILELTTRMTELLTGEVPIRCQDVTVYFSMEEWEYIEGHKDLYQDIVMMGDHRPPTSQDEVMDRNPPERCPRPLCSQDCPEGNVPEKHQGGDLIIIKVEEEEERMSGHHPCMREVKEEIPGGVTPENPSKDTDGTFKLSLNYKVEDEDLMQHSPGEDFFPLTVHPGPHSTDLSYNAPNHGEPSPDPSQVVTTRTDQREGKRFQCGECKKEFTKNSDLITHRKSHTEETYSCSLCGKCFTDKSELVSHERMHSAENPYSCSNCGERFAQKADLVRHQETHLEVSHQCPECGKYFKSKTSLVTHKKKNHLTITNSCSECGKRYKNKTSLVKHEITHTKKRYSCLDCAKSFISPSYLFKHKKIHTGETPYLCSECGKCFTAKSNLVIHQKIHTGETPYSCSECGKCFTAKSNLVIHQKIHTGKKP